MKKAGACPPGVQQGRGEGREAALEPRGDEKVPRQTTVGQAAWSEAQERLSPSTLPPGPWGEPRPAF